MKKRLSRGSRWSFDARSVAPTPKRPLTVPVVVVLREVTRIDPICKKSEECKK
ncbi:hypothetical protein CDL15_Pgr002617 [Punica granatum]|uniref:Uncharacterized protein n=1 Tax=Punica granatum TaxID=22663 RepID=A0A218W3Z5_PUNGR|nr:hypothetical protein CDL15_Pgr002617 [Punica granatum]